MKPRLNKKPMLKSLFWLKYYICSIVSLCTEKVTLIIEEKGNARIEITITIYTSISFLLIHIFWYHNRVLYLLY